MALSGNIRLSVQCTETKPLDLSSALDPLSYLLSQVVSDGAGASQANLMWHDRRTLASGANEDLDLAGVLSSAFGAVLTFARVKLLLVRNLGVSAAALTVGPAPSGGVVNFLGSSDRLPAGAAMLMSLWDATGWVITAGTADKIRIANAGGGSQDYEIIVIGAST